MSFQQRLWRFYGSRSGWRFWSVAENVLCHPRRVTAVQTIGKWLGSAGHRANLLSSRWREVGMAAVYGGSGKREMVFVAADFGVRR